MERTLRENTEKTIEHKMVTHLCCRWNQGRQLLLWLQLDLECQMIQSHLSALEYPSHQCFLLAQLSPLHLLKSLSKFNCIEHVRMFD